MNTVSVGGSLMTEMTDNQDQRPGPEAPHPFPGQQYPAAILPQSGYRTEPHPSGPQPAVTFPQNGPLPAAGPPSEPFPVVPQPCHQPRTRNKPVIILAALAAALFLAMGTFAALWLVEQGDHKATSSELQTVQGNLTKTADELRTAQQQKSQADSEKQRALRDAEATKPCLDAAKALVRAFTDEEADKQYDVMIQEC
jgi:hypothetical protein